MPESGQEMGQRLSDAAARRRPEGVAGESPVSYTPSNYFFKKRRERLKTRRFGCQNSTLCVDPGANSGLFVEKCRAVS